MKTLGNLLQMFLFRIIVVRIINVLISSRGIIREVI